MLCPIQTVRYFSSMSALTINETSIRLSAVRYTFVLISNVACNMLIVCCSFIEYKCRLKTGRKVSAFNGYGLNIGIVRVLEMF